MGECEWFETKKKCLIRKLRVVLLEDARLVGVGVGHGDHRVGLARLGEGLVVDASHADTQGHGEGGLLGAEGHLVEDHGAEVALVLGGAAEVEELALRTPSTRGTVGRSVRLGVCGAAAGVVNVRESAAIEAAAEARAAALLFLPAVRWGRF